MKTSGDRGGADGSREPVLPHRVREGGVVKRTETVMKVRRSSHTKQKLVEALRLEGVFGEYDQAEESPFFTSGPFDGLPVSPTKGPDNLLEVDEMSVDVFRSKTATPEPNGSLHKFDDAARDCDAGNFDDSGTNVDTRANGFPTINGEVKTDDVANIDGGAGIPTAPSYESTATNLSVWSGDVGNQPTSSDEIKNRFIDTLPAGIVNILQFPNLNLPVERYAGYITDQYGDPIYHVNSLDVDGMFPSQGGHSAWAVGTNIRGHSEDVTMSDGTTPHELLPILPRSPLYFTGRPLEVSSTEGASDTDESDTPSGC